MGANGNGNGQYKTQQFIDAIPGTGGIIAIIAKKVGCNWQTAKKYITTYPTVVSAYRDECESGIDMAESVVMKSIQNGDIKTAKWLLERRRKQVYATRQEINIYTNALSELSDSDLQSIIED